MPANNSDRSVVMNRMLSYTRAYLKPRNKIKEKQDEQNLEPTKTRSAASSEAIVTRHERHGESLMTEEGQRSLPKKKTR